MLWKDPVPSDSRSGRDAATQQFMEACRGSCIAIPSLQGLQAPVEEQGLLAANPGVVACAHASWLEQNHDAALRYLRAQVLLTE